MPLIRPCLVLMLIMSILTGVLYPAVVTALAQVLFPSQANGSLISDGNRVIGSALIAQPFRAPEWFWPRPSAVDYKADASGGANVAPVTPEQRKVWQDRADALRGADLLRGAGPSATVPVDLVTASGSGLDPDLSPTAVMVQIPRVAKARHLDPARVQRLVEIHIRDRQFGVLGEPRIAVLELNRALAMLPTTE